MEKIIPILMVLVFVMWVLVFIVGIIYQRKLKLLSPELGTKLHPGIKNKSISSDFKSIRFLIGGGYRSFDDNYFIRFCDRYRALVISWYIVFGIAIVSLTTIFIMNGKQ